MKLFRLAWIITAILVVTLSTSFVLGQASYPRHLVVTGGGFNQPQESFYAALQTRAITYNLDSVRITVLPLGLGSNPSSITDAEHAAQLDSAEQQRQEIEAGCRAKLTPPVSCSAVLVPVVTHKDALASPPLSEFATNPDGIYFLQNNAQSILEVLQGTELNHELVAAYQSGSILRGPGNLFSTRFLRGFRPKFGPAQALTFGAIFSGEEPGSGGIGIFPEQAVLETAPFSQNRLGRLLNAITGPDNPQIGIGIEVSTGFELIEDHQMQGFFGNSVVAILDAQTYQAANGVIYQPGTNLIGLRNVLLQLIPPGSTTYDLDQRQSSLAAYPDRFTRQFDQLLLPAGAGTILLTSNLPQDASGLDVLTNFTNLSGGQNANILILAAGYADIQNAQQDIQAISQMLEVPHRQIIVPADTSDPVNIDPTITGIILTGSDTAQIQLETLMDIQSSWLAGTPILADKTGAAFLGKQFISNQSMDAEPWVFSAGRYAPQPGLGFIQANIEPRGLQTNSWERMLTIAYQDPQDLAIGIAPGAAISFTPEQVTISGINVAALVDFRTANLATGESGFLEVANGLIDIYTPGETLQTLQVDVSAAPLHAPTPILSQAIETMPQPTSTPNEIAEPAQPESTEVPQGKPPTRTPRPTGTPVPTPPPSDPGTTNLMVFFGVLSVVVVIVGVWLNRQIAVE